MHIFWKEKTLADVWECYSRRCLPVSSAFSAAKAGDRLRRMRTIELASEGQSSSIEPDVKGLDELHVNGAPATILTNDADEYPVSFFIDDPKSLTNLLHHSTGSSRPITKKNKECVMV